MNARSQAKCARVKEMKDRFEGLFPGYIKACGIYCSHCVNRILEEYDAAVAELRPMRFNIGLDGEYRDLEQCLTYSRSFKTITYKQGLTFGDSISTSVS